MLLLLPLAIPFLGAGVILCLGNPRLATRAALWLGGLEIAALGAVIWQGHIRGALQTGRYLRADGLSSFYLMGIAFISGLVLVYASGYLRHTGEGRFSSPRWFY